MSQSPPEGLLERVRAEYLEMPGLRLSIDHLQRLCGVEPTLCQLVLDTLVDAKFLCLKSDGAYARLTEGEAPRPREAKADQKPHGSAPRQPSHVLFDNHPRTKPSQLA
jgi:hypothetical protein